MGREAGKVKGSERLNRSRRERTDVPADPEQTALGSRWESSATSGEFRLFPPVPARLFTSGQAGAHC